MHPPRLELSGLVEPAGHNHARVFVVIVALQPLAAARPARQRFSPGTLRQTAGERDFVCDKTCNIRGCRPVMRFS